MKTYWQAIVIAALISFSAGGAATAADLRIETRVYAADEKEPLSESVTYFREGVVYDFRTDDSRVTIYRPAIGQKPARFLLIDTDAKQRTEAPVDKIQAAMTKLRRWASMQEDPFLRFTGSPSFEEFYDEKTGELRLTSDQLSYRLVTEPLADVELRTQLRSFLDGYAQLQTLLEAGLPPEPRLKVNEALFRHGVAPLQVELTSGDDDRPSLRAEHVVDSVLSKGDRSRIDKALDQLTTFRDVSNAEFQQARRARKAKLADGEAKNR